MIESWIIATARVKDAILVHKDPEFLQVKSMVQLYNLPFKNGKVLTNCFPCDKSEASSIISYPQPRRQRPVF